MRKRAFDPFAALAHQAAAACSGDDCHTPAPGPRDPSTNHVAPCPARTRRTGYPRRPGRSGSDCCDTPYHRRSRLPIVNVGLRVDDLLGRGDGGLDDRRADIGTWPWRQSRRSPCRRHARLCAPDACEPSFIFVTVASGSWGCVQVRGLLLPLPIQSRQTLARGRLDPRGPRTRQKRLSLSPVSAEMLRIAAFAAVASIAMVLPVAGRPRRVVVAPTRSLIDQAPRARNRRMIGWRLVHGQPQKDRQRVRRAPRNPAFRVDAFEVADQQQAK